MAQRLKHGVPLASVFIAAAWCALAGCGQNGRESVFVGDDMASGPTTGDAGLDGGASVQGDDTPDAGGSVFVSGDAWASGNGDNGGYCNIGNAGSLATTSTLNLFGDVVYYLDGGTLPPGKYRIKYTGGCMKYDFIFEWQATAAPPNCWYVVGDTTDDRIIQAPASTTQYADYSACVQANLATPSQDFAFDGGKLGLWLNDFPYQDNVAGEDGGNPSWSLQLLEKCPPNLAPR
jgi:hypothetical protein